MRVVYIGTGAIGLPTLHWLLQSDHDLVGVVTQPDKPAGRGRKLTAPPIKNAIAGRGVPLLQPPKIKEATVEIGALAPDVIVVMAYGQILPRGILNLASRACLNLHASILPRWRGAAPIQAAIAAGDHETGITVMYMDAGLDTGDILLVRAVAIAFAETGGSLHDKLANVAPGALANALAQLENRSAPRMPQDNARVSYSPKLDRAEGRIDWRSSAAEIERMIRAYDPWPGAFTSVLVDTGRSPQTLKIFRAGVLPESGRPGSLLHLDGEIVVAAGDASLLLEEVQLAGKKRMSGAEFSRGLSAPLRLSA